MANLIGHWRNSQGSHLFIRSTTPLVEGWYATEVGDARALGKRHQLTGLATDELVGFSVAWGESRSLTSWTARIVVDGDGKRSLHSMWHLARVERGEGVNAKPAGLWETFITNASIFEFVGGHEPPETV